jgi:CRP-like cAMP-binding protein
MSSDRNPFARFLTHYDQGAVLFAEGEEGEDMYIVQSGRVAIKKKVKDGETTLAVMEKGDFFGEMAMLERLPRSASAEVVEAGDLIKIDNETFGDMIKANPEIAIRMLRKYSIRLRDANNQIEKILAAGGQLPPPEVEETDGGGTIEGEALGYFIASNSGNVFPIHKSDALIGRYDSVTGMSPDIDLTHEDQSRNISRRHARVVIKDGAFFVAEEIGTMNGTFLNGTKLANGVLTPVNDGDELMLCRLSLTFRTAGSKVT